MGKVKSKIGCPAQLPIEKSALFCVGNNNMDFKAKVNYCEKKIFQLACGLLLNKEYPSIGEADRI